MSQPVNSKKIDMSDKAISRRLKAASDLRDLCLALGSKNQRSSVVAESSEAYGSERTEVNFKVKG